MDFTYIFISLPLHTVCFIGTLLRWFPKAQVKSLFLCEVSLFPSSLTLALSVPIDPLSAPNHSLNCSLLPGKRSPRKPSFYKGEKLRELYNSFKNVALNRLGHTPSFHCFMQSHSKCSYQSRQFTGRNLQLTVHVGTTSFTPFFPSLGLCVKSGIYKSSHLDHETFLMLIFGATFHIPGPLPICI